MKNWWWISSKRFLLSIGPLAAVLLQVGMLALCALAVGWLAAPVYADTINVDDDTGTDGSGCGALNSPCRTIPYAVNSASSGDTVFVWAGTYTETVTLKSGVIISGANAAATFLDGEDSRGPVVRASNAAISTSTVLRGFTIHSGRAATNGGGLSFTGGASPLVENCVVYDNLAVGYGGGIYIDWSSPVISATQVLSNTASRGGGIYVTFSGQSRLENAIISRNVSTGTAGFDGGGGIYIWSSPPTIVDTLVLTNSATLRGGGIYAYHGATLTRTQVINNTSNQAGGGLYQRLSTEHVAVSDGRFERNVAKVDAGGGLYVNGSATLSGTYVLSNTAGASGGGLYVTGDVDLIATQVISNYAQAHGGGLYQAGVAAEANVRGGRFERNVSGPFDGTYVAGSGGGIYASGNTTINDTLFFRNSGKFGGALRAHRGLEIVNSLFAENAGRTGVGVYILGSAGTQNLRHITIASNPLDANIISSIYVNNGTVSISNTIVSHTYLDGIVQEGGTLREDYNLYYGNGRDIYSGAGTLYAGMHSLHGQDPGYVDRAASDYHIGANSAALDAGTFAGVAADIDGDARPTNPAQPDLPDIGSDENKSQTIRRPVTDTMTFGAACTSIIFTDTGGLQEGFITITVKPGELPSSNPTDKVVKRAIEITPSNSGAFSATLVVAYEDSEAGGLDESKFALYRWTGTIWHRYPSTVDMTNNVVTATGVTTFSQWAIGEQGSFPTAVELAFFTVRPVVEGIRLEWQTATEVDSLGFNLYHAESVAGQRLKLNDVLIPSQMPGSPTGATYQFLDDSVIPSRIYYYWLETVGVDGLSAIHGPRLATAQGYRYFLPLLLR